MVDDATGKQFSGPLFSARPVKRNFTLISNNALHDPRLSLAAKGALAVCLSGGELFSKEWLLSASRDSPPSVSDALKELVTAGYLKIFIQGDSKHYHFFDELDDLKQQHLSMLTPAAPAAPAAPQERKRGRSAASARLRLSDWLEPHREALEKWLDQRAKAHPKLAREISSRSMTALLYAKECDVLGDFCELASEATWQSLGFNGFKGYINKLVQDKQPAKSGKPAMSAINYTLR
jgi:hypothetical protein